MSSLPDSEKVRNLRLLIKKHRELCKELSEIRIAAAKLDSLEYEARQNQQAITKAIDEMDCKADGNAGWNHRIVWMLTEMLTQEEEG